MFTTNLMKKTKSKKLLIAVITMLMTCDALAENYDATLAHWSFNYDYTIANGIGTPNSTAINGNGNVDLSSIKLVPNEKNSSDDIFLTAVRPAYNETYNKMQDTKAAYLEYKSISAEGAALHMTSPLPNPAEYSEKYTWGSSEFTFGDGSAKYSYQNPYDYFEIELTTTGYKNVTFNIKAAGHKSSTQYYAVLYSTDHSTWTLVGDEYLAGASYNKWTTNNITVSGINNSAKAYVRIMPAKNWQGCRSDNPFTDNQFNIDDVTVTAELNVPKAEISAMSIAGQTVTAGTDYDYECKIPKSFSGKTISIKPSFINAALTITAKDDSDKEVAVTYASDSIYTIPVPAQNKNTYLTFTLSPNEGCIAPKSVYTMRVFHIGDLKVSKVTIDGTENVQLLDGLNGTGNNATYNDGIYTTLPIVKATMIDGSEATVTNTYSGTTAVYSLYSKTADEEKTFTLNINNVHVYATTSKDTVVDLVYTSEGRSDSKWTNGLYTVTGGIDGNNNQCWKFKNGDYTLSMPANIKVKQVTFVGARDHYNDTGYLSAFTSGDATVYIPTKHGFDQGDGYNLIIVLDGHKAGTDMLFSFANVGQVLPSSVRLVVEKVAVTSAPILKNKTVTSTSNTNHCVVALSFDREMAAGTATVGNKTVTADGGSSILYFPIWDLNYNTDYSFTAKAGDIKDIDGNSNAEDISINFKVGDRKIAEKAAYDFVISSTAEFTAALNSVCSSNSNENSARKTIFIKNGTYDFGSTQLKLDAYNISIIGESRNGVIIKGKTTGISDHTFDMGSKTGTYIQDVTFLNDFDYGTGAFNGVAVALSGGKKAVLKNVRLLSDQDTYVTGERTYLDSCEIHGTVDFICGGGDIFFDKNSIVIENRGGCCLAAPSTSKGLKWGYVFNGCTIKAMDGASAVTDGSYSLGRPWQNEPRIYYLNTKMDVLPNDNGWAAMSNLATHFYEYNSMDASGNKIDLTKRGNSSTSTNKYTPILTDEEATQYNVRNVLGGSDSWAPIELTVQASAPTVSLNKNIISWNNDDQVRCYVIYKDGAYLTNQSGNSYTIPDDVNDANYTVYSTNIAGGLGGSTTIPYVRTTVGNHVDAQDSDDFSIYSIDGKLLKNGTDNLNGLKSNVYIINGKKVVIR
jgi:pectin methylesterase-like acyl-CoA thioesterase